MSIMFGFSLPCKVFDKCQSCLKSFLGRQILPQAFSSTLVFPFPRTIFLEEFQFLGDCRFNSLTAKVRGTSVCVFSISAPARQQKEFKIIPLIMAMMILEGTGWVEPSQCVPNSPWVKLAVSSGKMSNPDSYLKRISANICSGLFSPSMGILFHFVSVWMLRRFWMEPHVLIAKGRGRWS